MKTPNVHLRSRKLKGGRSWYLDWSVAGKRYFETIGVVPKYEAVKAQSQKIKDLAATQGYISSSTEYSLSDLIVRHLQIRGKVITESTLRKYEYYQRKIEELIDKAGREMFTDLKKITPARFDLLVEELYNFTDKNHTRAAFLAFLKGAENTALKKGLIARKFTYEAPTPKMPRTMNANYFKKEELKKIWANMEPFYIPICQFQVNTGLRIGELCNLRWADVNLSTNTLTVQAQVNQGQVNYQPKGASSGGGSLRHVPLNNAALEILKERKQKLANRPEVANMSEAERSKLYVFTSVRGKQLYRRIVNDKLEDALEKAGITDKSGTHTFRHTFISYAVQKGVDTYRLAQYTGHSSQRILELYGHLSPENDKELFDGLAD